jgi:hypothetical protein
MAGPLGHFIERHCGRSAQVYPIDFLLVEAGQGQGGFPQCFGRRAATGRWSPAGFIAFNYRHALPEIGGELGGAFSGRARTDDNHIIIVGHWIPHLIG